jgi:hypothetical protein
VITYDADSNVTNLTTGAANQYSYNQHLNRDTTKTPPAPVVRRLLLTATARKPDAYDGFSARFGTRHAILHERRRTSGKAQDIDEKR